MATRKLPSKGFPDDAPRYIMTDNDLRYSKSLLCRMLSTRADLSTIPTLDEKLPCRQYMHVGQGQCGTIFAMSGTDEVVKISNGPAKDSEQHNDARVHLVVESAFRNAAEDMRCDIMVSVLAMSRYASVDRSQRQQ